MGNSSGVTGAAATNGVAMVDFSESDLDMAVAMLQVQTQRVKNMDVALKLQMTEMQGNNVKTADYNSLLGTLRALKNCEREAKKGDNASDSSKTNGKIIPTDGNAADFRQTAQAQCKKLGIEFKCDNPGQLEVMIQDVKSAIDGFGNTQQMDMIRLQNLMSRRNESFDTMTNLLKKIQDQKDRVVSHLA